MVRNGGFISTKHQAKKICTYSRTCLTFASEKETAEGNGIVPFFISLT